MNENANDQETKKESLEKKSSNRRSLLAVMITFALASLSATIIFPILAPLFLDSGQSLIRENIPPNVRAILLGFFLASFPLAQLIFSPLCGEFSDKKGRKPVFLVTIALEIFGYALCAIAIMWHHLSIFFIGRFFTGLAAGNMTVCLATIVDLAENEKKKVRYFSYGSALAGVMFVLGPFIGGKLADKEISSFFNAAFPMWAGAILATLNLLIMAFLYKETLKEKCDKPFDPLGAFHNLQLAFRTQAVRDLYILYFFFLFSWNMLYQFLPAVLVQEFHSSTSVIGDVSALAGCIWIVGTILINLIARTKIEAKYIVLVSLLIFSFTSVFIPSPNTMRGFLITTGIAVFFAGGIWPLFTGAISNAADQKIQGKVLGLSQSIQSLAMMLAPLIGGFFLQAHSKIPFIVSSISALIAAGLLTKTRRAFFQT